MPVKLPPGLPAERVLRTEGVDVVDTSQSGCRDGRPLRIALLNLMPDKAKTETQFARLLGATPVEVELTLFLPDSHTPKTAPASHIASFYERWSAIRRREFDGLIVTGAPVENLDFKEVTYWQELTEIFEWARRRVCRSLYVCWAGQAALHYFHGVPKHRLSAKMFGIFPHRVATNGTPLIGGFGDRFTVPVSRHTEVRATDLPPRSDLRVLADSEAAGLCLLEDRPRGAIYMFNHLEYDTSTLDQEYRRDLAVGRSISVPRNYYPADDPTQPPVNTWRPYGHLLIQNWIAEIRRCVARDVGRDEAVEWLLEERPVPSRLAEPCSYLLISGAAGPDTLSAVLRRLARLGHSPRAAKVHRRDGGTQSIAMRCDALPGPLAQKLARHLLELDEVHRVVYRTADGTGGLFVADGSRGTRRRQPAAA